MSKQESRLEGWLGNVSALAKGIDVCGDVCFRAAHLDRLHSAENLVERAGHA